MGDPMKFHNFLLYLKEKRNCDSIAELYSLIGGQDALNMSLRNFNLLASGQLLPTIHVFIAIFDSIKPEEYVSAIKCFMATHSNEKSGINKFLNTNLLEVMPRTKNSIWNSVNEIQFTVEQLSYLSKNQRALRIHHKILLDDKINISEFQKDTKIIDDLIKLGLAEKKGNYLYYHKPYLKLPNFKDSPPSELREGNNFIAETFKTFLSFEGDDNQTINYVCANLDKDSAIKMHQELFRIKELCLQMAQNSNHEKNVPFLMISLGKTLANKELR
jgi:hypothetical protein